MWKLNNGIIDRENTNGCNPQPLNHPSVSFNFLFILSRQKTLKTYITLKANTDSLKNVIARKVYFKADCCWNLKRQFENLLSWISMFKILFLLRNQPSFYKIIARFLFTIIHVTIILMPTPVFPSRICFKS